MTERALEWIDEWADRPFFIYFPLPAPHTPILPTPEFQGKSGTNSYGDFVLMVDDVVGQVCAKLREKGIYDDTLVIFTSDNGCSPMADYPALLAAGHNPSYVFRGHKADIYEGGHRIPFVASWPNGIPAGSERAQTLCLSDLMATAAELIGEKLPETAAPLAPIGDSRADRAISVSVYYADDTLSRLKPTVRSVTISRP